MTKKTDGVSIAYWINAEKREVTQVEIDRNQDGLKQLQKHVGGYIEIAHQWRPGGEVCFVDEEGTFKSYTYGFKIAGSLHEFFVGNGIVVGAEYPNSSLTRPPTFPLGFLQGIVSFVRFRPRVVSQ